MNDLSGSSAGKITAKVASSTARSSARSPAHSPDDRAAGPTARHPVRRTLRHDHRQRRAYARPLQAAGTASIRRGQRVRRGLVVHPPPAEVRPRLLGRPRSSRSRSRASIVVGRRRTPRTCSAIPASGSGSSSTAMPSARAMSRIATMPWRSATRAGPCGMCGFAAIWKAAASITASERDEPVAQSAAPSARG